MSSDDVDPDGLSQGSLDTIERLMVGLVEAPPEPVFTEGAHVGRYVLLRRLGAGAMGVVWAAHDPQLDRKVALKILRRSAVGSAGSQAAERAAREARALARLVHPNIVAVHDGGLDGEALYVVMELVDGVTLRAHLAERARSFDEIADAFVQAGTGLAAAHDAKLVHRDFKPDNVLVGKDGRVRVADFGLARIAGAADRPSDAPTPPTTTTAEPALTATAAFVGTLAYMAPEQMTAGVVDARADQFAFAVSWWGAVHGVEPFAGDTFAARRAAIEAGPRAGERKVPAWLAAILRRALAPEPDARFPTMHALLAAVARGRGRRRRTMIGAAAVVAAAAIVPAVWWSRGGGDGPEPCQGGADEIAQVWNPARAAAIAGAFPSGSSGQAATHAGDRFAAYAREWAAGHRAACRATSVDHAQSADLLDRRMVCLARALARLDALLAWIPRAGVTAAAEITIAIDQLPGLDQCADVAALGAMVPQPSDPDVRARVTAAAARLDELEAGVLDPTRADLTTETAKALEDARAAGWAPLIAEALAVHADALYRGGDGPAAEAAYVEAVRWALEAADDHRAAQAMADVAWAAGERSSADEAHTWLTLARAMSRRLGDPPQLALSIATTATQVATSVGTPDEAVAEALAALTLASSPDVEPGRIGGAQFNLGLAQRAAGQYDRSVEELQRSIDSARAAVGDDHPLVADRLQMLGLTLIDMGRFADARAAIERGLAIRTRWYGENGIDVVTSLQALGVIHQRLGEVDDARTSFERALAILVALPVPDANRQVELDANLAILEAQAGRFEVALERASAALATLESLTGPDHPSLIDPLVIVGYIERELGQLDASFAHLHRAVAVGEPGLGPDHPARANPRVELGVTETARGHLPEARAQFERVIAAGEADPNVPRAAVAEASLHLAKLVGRGARARQLAASARDLYAAEGATAQRDAAAAWLAAH